MRRRLEWREHWSKKMLHSAFLTLSNLRSAVREKRFRVYIPFINSILPFVFLGCLLFFLSTFFAYFFTVDQVVIQGTNTTPIGIKTWMGTNILFIKERTIADALLKKNIDISNVTAEKKYPSTIIVTVEKRIPVAQIVSTILYCFIDEGGFVYTCDGVKANLPEIISLTSGTRLGDHFDTGYKTVFETLKKLEANGVSVDKVIIKRSDEIQYILPETIVIGDATIEGDMFVSSLQSILRGFRIEGKNPYSIDLRFEKAVVR